MLVRENKMLDEAGIKIVIDEYKFGNTKYERGRFIDGKWAFDGIERRTNKRFMAVVPEILKNMLMNAIRVQ